MKKVVMTIAMTLLVGVASGWAQSSSSASTESNSGRQGSSSVNKASKANNSQIMGKGVPYNKEKEQFGKQISKKRSGPTPPSSVSAGPGMSDAGKRGNTPGSHTANRDVKVGRKASAKTGNQ